MNDLTVQTNGAVATQDDFDPYAEYGRESSTNIVGKLIKFSKGDYLVGDDKVKVNTQVVANMANLLIGWIRWEDNKPAETIMGLLGEGHRPQKRDTLGFDDEADWPLDTSGKPQDPWQETNYLVVKDVTDGELYTFTTSSAGGRGAISKLCKDYGTKRKMYPGKFPIITLGVDEYKHKDRTIGWVKTPLFKIVGWVPVEAFDSDVDGATGEVKNDAQHRMQLENEADKLLDRVGRGGDFHLCYRSYQVLI